MFSINVENQANYDDLITELYSDYKTRNQVLQFFATITSSERVAKAILENSIAHNVRPSLAFAVAYVESNYNPKAYSTNASGTRNRGLFQLNSSVFKISNDKLYDPYHNANLGISHLQQYIDLSDNEFLALAAYNAGITKVSQNGIPTTTFTYISEVAIMERKIMNFFLQVWRSVGRRAKRLNKGLQRFLKPCCLFSSQNNQSKYCCFNKREEQLDCAFY